MANPKHPLDAAAESIAGWAFCDSSVLVDIVRLRNALAEDVAAAADNALPTEQECYDLVCGSEAGDVPAALVKAFPNTHALLDEYWQ